MAYEPWTALGEFVDNSTQSYFNNKEALDKAFAAEGTSLEVSIVYEKDGSGVLRISDNAMGMNRDELTHAMHVGLPPAYAAGRSRYGLGMKQAACWFGNNWTIVTKKLGETTEYTVSVDVEKAADGNDDLHEMTVEDLPADLHYTRIEITNLNVKPQTRTQGKIRQFLSGMYKLDIQKGALSLKWQNTPLDSEDDWTFVKDTLGSEYRKDFETSVNGKRAWGWVGVLDVGGRPKAGFAIAHNDRMIRVWPDAWHPEELYGQSQGSNDLVNQRLIGMIHLDDFDVSHTKDAIHWVGDEEDQVQAKLKEICAEYREVARQTRKSRRHQEVAIQLAARALEQELRSNQLSDLIDAQPPEPEVIAQDETLLLEETDTVDVDFKSSFEYAGRTVTVLGKLDSTKSLNDPYVISEATQEDRVVVVINMNHPHLGTIDENGLLNYFRHCTYDALAEWRARNQVSSIEPSTIRKLKDGFLRLQFDIQMSE